MHFLRQNTAVDVLIGPFTDATDGITAETGLTPAVKLSKNGQALAAKNDATTPTHDADGYYNCELDATDTNTTGHVRLIVAAASGAGPVFHDYQVLDATVYDTIYTSAPTILTAGDIGQVFESTVSSVESTTILQVADTIVSDDDWIGLTVMVEDTDTNERAVRWLTDVDQANDKITINAALPFTPASPDIVRIESRQHPSYAIQAYDPPTRGEATSDRDIITALLPTALSSAGNMKTNIVQVNDVTIGGTGTTADPFGPV